MLAFTCRAAPGAGAIKTTRTASTRDSESGAAADSAAAVAAGAPPPKSTTKTSRKISKWDFFYSLDAKSRFELASSGELDDMPSDAEEEDLYHSLPCELRREFRDSGRWDEMMERQGQQEKPTKRRKNSASKASCSDQSAGK
eukprot:tig00020510_g9796.t1